MRTALTVEMWDAINGAWLELRRLRTADMTRDEFARFLDWVKSVTLAFDGSAYRTMLRNDAFWFTRLGGAIERADNTARILDVKYHVLLPETERVGGSLDYFQWTTILREVSALTAYHWVYRESVKPWLVADLLILNRQMPRSLANCYEILVRHLDLIADAYGRRGPSQRLASNMPGPALDHQHRQRVQAGPARVHQRLHLGEQPPRLRHRRAVPDVIRPAAPPSHPAAAIRRRQLSPMRIRIVHDTHYRYERPVRGSSRCCA